jgi:predicted exporter
MNIPSPFNSIVYLLASIVGITVVYYLRKWLLPWLQAQRNRQDTQAGTEARTNTQRENQQANSDSDALDQREREHDGG